MYARSCNQLLLLTLTVFLISCSNQHRPIEVRSFDFEPIPSIVAIEYADQNGDREQRRKALIDTFRKLERYDKKIVVLKYFLESDNQNDQDSLEKLLGGISPSKLVIQVALVPPEDNLSQLSVSIENTVLRSIEQKRVESNGDFSLLSSDPAIQKVASAYGHVSVFSDFKNGSGIYKDYPLYISSSGTVIPSLPLTLSILYLELQNMQVEENQLTQLFPSPEDIIRNGDQSEHELVLDYSNKVSRVNMYDYLDGDSDGDAIVGRSDIIIVCEEASQPTFIVGSKNELDIIELLNFEINSILEKLLQ